MAKFETNQVDINGNGKVIIYQRSDLTSKKWHCRISVQGSTGYKRFSTKETDQRQAERVALDKYEELYFKVKRGGSLKGKSFKVVYEEYCDWVDATKTQRTGDHNKQVKRKVEKYGLSFFKTKSVDDITEGDLIEFMIHSKNLMKSVNGTEPSASTLRGIGTAHRELFQYAKSKGYIKEVLPIPVPSAEQNPRPDFTKEEWRTLTGFMRKWVNEPCKGTRSVGIDRKRHRERFYLQHYVLVMGNTGCRVGEMRSVKWHNLDRVVIEEGDERLLISVDGKTGKRQVVANAGVENFIKRLWDYRTEELGATPSLEEYVFCKPNGKFVQYYKGSFTRLLLDSGLRENNDGELRTLYSLRHTYATMRVNEVPVYQLAINMGTSVEMIENFYGHSRSSDSLFASTVTKGNQTSGSKVLPWSN